MNKNVIISFANERARYVDNLARLSNSLRNNFDGDFVSWIGEEALGCKSHTEENYGFKIHAFRKAQAAGYKNCLWLDTSVFAVNNVEKVFDDIEANGMCFQDAGHFIGNYSSDKCLEYHGITRDAAMEMKCIGNAGLLGLSFDDTDANTFLNEWEASLNAGVWNGAWDNKDKSNSKDERCLGHRHDLSNSSAIIHKMNKFHLAYPGDEVLMYGGIFSPIINSTIIFKAEG